MDNFYLTVFGWSVRRQERAWLRNTAALIEKKFPKPVIVNIGVLHGATMHCLRAGSSSAQLFGIDIDYKTYPVEREKALRATMIKGDSGVCHIDFHPEIHFLFVDGDHRYSGVSADIVGWAHKVVIGGIIGFHDYAPAAVNLRASPEIVGVRKAVDEWIAREGDHWKSLQPVKSVRGFRRLA